MLKLPFFIRINPVGSFEIRPAKKVSQKVMIGEKWTN